MNVLTTVELGTVDYYGQQVKAIRTLLENGQWKLEFVDNNSKVVSQFIH